jgi:hypothetical protein
VVVTRDDTTAGSAAIVLHGLQPGNTYKVHFQDDTRVLSMTGQQLMTSGVRVNLPLAQTAEIVYVDPM